MNLNSPCRWSFAKQWLSTHRVAMCLDTNCDNEQTDNRPQLSKHISVGLIMQNPEMNMVGKNCEDGKVMVHGINPVNIAIERFSKPARA